jgi:Fe-S cluster assembly ATPase SufC
MFLALQYPVVVPGISMTNFLRTALNAKRGYDGKDKSKQISPKEFRSMLKTELEVLHMDDSFLPRYINDGFSGGEKKRAEILQMAMLKPDARPGAGRADHHPLHAHPPVHQAGLRPRARGRQVRAGRWT